MKGRMCSMKIREALRLREMEINNTQISQSINCSHFYMDIVVNHE